MNERAGGVKRAGQQIYPKDSLPGQTPVQSIRLTPAQAVLVREQIDKKKKVLDFIFFLSRITLLPSRKQFESVGVRTS
jgi:hypothetical protein